MAQASKKHMRSGPQGKGAGKGALTDEQKDKIEENMVLSNRDKSQHKGSRSLDSKEVQTEQLQDTSMNRYPDDGEQGSG